MSAAIPPGHTALATNALTFMRRRGLRAALHAAVQHLRARWYFRSATSLGSARLTGRARVLNEGAMTIGDRVILDGTTVRLEFACFRGAELTVGDGTYFNYGTNVSATRRVTIGRNCAIGQYSIIMDNDYHRPENLHAIGDARPIEIGDNAWLGARVIVLRGSIIGEGAVIGANSLVNGHIPPYTLAAGSPARVIRHLQEAP